jgi:hypothetical protein
MPPGDLPAEVVVFLLRLGLVLLIYLFLGSAFVLARRELRQQARPPSDAPGRLIVLDGGHTSLPPGHELPLKPLTTVGRAPACTLVFNDSYVSATHAVLTWRDGQWWLKDAGSTNGTFLNQRPVTDEEVPLAFGDVLSIGSLRLKLAP